MGGTSMIPNYQPLRKKTIERMLNYFMKDPNGKDLTVWEQDFVDSIYEQFQDKGDLSTRQCEILERLYDK